MDANWIIDGLISYLGLIVLLVFHEFGHAWVALKCGDDTARLQGRCSLNPIVHIDPIGTVLLPLMMIFLPFGVGRFMIGWAKPVPVNANNLRNGRWDDILVSMAGPAMNFVLAVGLVALARIALLVGSGVAINLFLQMASLSLLLCFFNLIPIPPLDGSHVLRNLTDMSWEAYAKFAQFGFILVIIAVNLSPVRRALGLAVNGTLVLMGTIFGLA